MSDILADLFAIIVRRKRFAPAGSYTAELLAAGRTEIAKKVGEEAIEVILAAQSQSDGRVVSESADLIYHLLVLLAERGVEWRAVEEELTRRRFTRGSDTRDPSASST